MIRQSDLTALSYKRRPDAKQVRAFRRNLLLWYKNHGRSFPWRRQSNSKYQYIIAEVLLQRTRAEAVASFFPVFIADFPSWSCLASANLEALEVYLKPLGLWRRRSVSILSLAKKMQERRGRFPKSRIEIEALPGVGQYIANAIQMFCLNQPKPLLDVNMARVLERVFGNRKLADIRYDPFLQDLAADLVDFPQAKHLNWAILDLASGICTIRDPRCSQCPLVSLCASAKIT